MAIRVGELQALWGLVRARFAAYELLLPGDPSFICQPHACDASCCRNFTVALGTREAEGLREASGWSAARSLESEDGEPIALPLVTPFVLGRRDGHCVFLGDDLACGQYEARPDACRSYPHQVLFVDGDKGRAGQPSTQAGMQALDAVVAGRRVEGATPLLLRHTECPGFTGPLLAEGEWAALLRETYGRSVRASGEASVTVIESPP